MKYANIPNSVKVIEQIAFCMSGLEHIYCRIQHPEQVELGPNAFDGPIYSSLLHVPQGTLGLYSSTEGWRDFHRITDDINDNVIPGDVDGNGAVNVSDVTTLVNIILDVVAKDEQVADINGDGKVNVSDVTALINIILGVE